MLPENKDILKDTREGITICYVIVLFLFILSLILFAIVLIFSIKKVRNFLLRFCSSKKEYFNIQNFLIYLGTSDLNIKTKQYFSLDSRNDYILMNSAIIDGKSAICLFPLGNAAKNLIDRLISLNFSSTICLNYHRDLYIEVMVKFAKHRKILRIIPIHNDKSVNDKNNTGKVIISANQLFSDLESSSNSIDKNHLEYRYRIDTQYIERFIELKNNQNIKNNGLLSTATREIFRLWNFLIYDLPKYHNHELFIFFTVQLSTIEATLLIISENKIIKHLNYFYQFNRNIAKYLLAYSLEVICLKIDHFNIKRRRNGETNESSRNETVIKFI